MAKKDLKAFLKNNKFTIASNVINKYKICLQNYLKDINSATPEEIALVEQSIK